VLATAKHFPGHGDTSLDSHLTLPVVAHPRSRLEAVELLPFREAIRAGVGAIMTAHVVYPALDRELPATLSPAIIRLLRETLGFDGLVVSDSMQMRAVADHYTPGAAAVAAVRAGVDVLLALGRVEAQWEALDAVRAAARQGRIDEARLRQAAQRVLAAKRRLGLFAGASVAEGEAARFVGRREHLELADRIAAAAATIVHDTRGTIPLPPGPVHVATNLLGPELADRLTAGLRAAGRAVSTVKLNGRGDPASQAGVPGATVVPFAAAAPGDGPLALRVREATLAALRRGPAVAVSLDAPYPLAAAADGCAALAVYGSDPHAIAAAAGVLAGTIRAGGTLPVTIPLPPGRA
jgi:beta-N-acetylhexosaminidase